MVAPISRILMTTQRALDFHARLGIGVDVDWCKNPTDRILFQQARDRGDNYPAKFAARGFDHARIRVKEYNLQHSVIPGLTLSMEIVEAVELCNQCGLTAVVAFQAEDFKERPTAEERDRVVEWWREIALLLRNYDCAFNLVIETTLEVRHDDAALNDLYQHCADTIAFVDPDRVMIIPPSDICDPARLLNLVVPEGHHIFVESHFYAGGFDRDTDWTPPGTVRNRKKITNNLDLITSWMAQTGVPVWIGAILLGNYNGDPSGEVNLTYQFSVEDQVELIQFFKQEAAKRQIPFAVNSDDKLMDTSTGRWIELMEPVVNELLS